MDAYKLSPRWCATTRFAGLDGKLRLLPGDVALALRVAGALGQHVPQDREQAHEFEQAMRRVADGPDDRPAGSPFEFGLREACLRDVAFAARAVDRMALMTNRGSRCFVDARAVHEGKAVLFTMAGGAALLRSHLLFADRMEACPASLLPYADRHHVVVRPDQFARFESVSSAPVALRALAWLTSPSRDGLPGHHHADLDERGRWTVRSPMDRLADLWGITVPRETVGHYENLFATVSADLAGVGVTFKATCKRVGKSRANWVFRFYLAEDARGWAADYEQDEVLEPRAPHAIGRLRAPVAPAVVEVAATTPAAEPVREAAVEPQPAPVVEEPFDATAFAPEDADAGEVLDAAPEPMPEATPAHANDDDECPYPPGSEPGDVYRLGVMDVAEVGHDEPDDAVVTPPALVAMLQRSGLLPERWTEDWVAPLALRRTSTVRDMRPPWLKRRLRYEAVGLPGVWLSQPLEIDPREIAGELGVSVWRLGMSAGAEQVDDAESLVRTLDWADRRLRWVQACSTRDTAAERIEDIDKREAFLDEWRSTEGARGSNAEFEGDPSEDYQASYPPDARDYPPDERGANVRRDDHGVVDECGNSMEQWGLRREDRTADEARTDAWFARTRFERRTAFNS